MPLPFSISYCTHTKRLLKKSPTSLSGKVCLDKSLQGPHHVAKQSTKMFLFSAFATFRISSKGFGKTKFIPSFCWAIAGKNNMVPIKIINIFFIYLVLVIYLLKISIDNLSSGKLVFCVAMRSMFIFIFINV